MIKKNFKKLLEEIIQQTDPKNDRVILTDQCYILIIRHDKKENIYHVYDILINDDKFDIDYRRTLKRPQYFEEITASYTSNVELETIHDVLEYIFNWKEN